MRARNKNQSTMGQQALGQAGSSMCVPGYTPDPQDLVACTGIKIWDDSLGTRCYRCIPHCPVDSAYYTNWSQFGGPTECDGQLRQIAGRPECYDCITPQDLCAPGFNVDPISCGPGTRPARDRAGCYGCATIQCPRPFILGPQVCQQGWQSVHHPQIFECVACAPIPAAALPPRVTEGDEIPSTQPSTPFAAGVSTSTKIAIGAGALLLLFGALYGRRGD